MRVNPKIFNLYDVFHQYNQTSNYNTLRILSSGNAMICNAGMEMNKSLWESYFLSKAIYLEVLSSRGEIEVWKAGESP